MEITIIETVLMIANLFCVVWMYRKKNYRMAIFNGFAAGVCFMVLITAL